MRDLLDWLTGRSVLRRIETKVDRLMTQNDEIREVLDAIGGSVESLRTSLSGVAADVTDLKTKLDNLPAGEPVDPALLEELRTKAADIAEVTDRFAQLDASYPASAPSDPAPEGDSRL